jgi:hypothetical protein
VVPALTLNDGRLPLRHAAAVILAASFVGWCMIGGLVYLLWP